MCDSEELEFRWTGYITLRFEPGYSYFASRNIIKDASCHDKKTFKVNVIDADVSVLELINVDWKGKLTF